MGVLAWIRKIQHALHECAESIHRSEERKRNKQLPPDKPIAVRAVVSFDDKAVADAKTQAEREHSTQESIKNATWLAFVAVAIYALITLGVWFQMIKQNRIASAALSQAEKQWKAQQRPWVGLFGSVELPSQPRFQVFPANPPKHTGIELAASFKIKNFGPSPAFRTASKVEVLATGNDLKLPQFQMETACAMADGSGEKEGSVIFPSGEITANFETISGNQIELNYIRRIWVMACTSYQEGMSKSIHQSKFWIMSFMIPENTTPTVVERGPAANIFTMPVRGWQMVKTEAD